VLFYLTKVGNWQQNYEEALVNVTGGFDSWNSCSSHAGTLYSCVYKLKL
jgi:hypothetical protein